MVVVGEEVQHRAVGGHDVLWVTAERDPAERPLALAEERADIRRDESLEVECAREAAHPSLVTDGVAVVEDFRATVHEADHGLDMLGHRDAGAIGVFLGLPGGVVVGIGQVDALG